MKGLTHLTVGVAWASCWPQAVAAGAEGHPGLFILGAAFGLLPDTVDFRLLRYLYPHDMEIVSDPLRPDPALVAKALATAVARARASGKPFRVRLHTVRVGSGLWHQYRLRFDVAEQRLHVTFSGVVNTSREPVVTTGATPAPVTHTTPLPCAVALDYRAECDVDIFDGPTFAFEPLPDGRVRIRFIPWHREYTHSLVVAAALGLGIGLAGGWLAGLVAAGAWALHVLADQTGFMGSNLFFPFTRSRTPGCQMAEADNAWVNAAVIGFSVLLIFWNLARQAMPPVPGLSFPALVLVGGVVPLGLAALATRWLRRLDGARVSG